MKVAGSLVLLVGAMAFGSSVAQTVYRCGQSYSHEPCPQGKSIDVQDHRTEAQRAAALDAQRRQGVAADELAERRARQEAKSAPGVAGIKGHRTSTEPVRDQAQPKKKRKSSREEPFKAEVPGSAPKKKRS